MKKAQTWIITCFYLQLLLLNPLVKAQSRCGNPVTDDVNNIGKLVGNLPNDYMIPLKYVRKMDSLPNNCWLHLMVPELSKSLNNLLSKFNESSDMPNVLSNYSIINNLRRIINDLMACLSSTKYKSFRQHNDHLYEEGKFIPAEFFEHFYNIISVYNIFAKSQVQSDCVLPSTTETLSNDSSIHATNPFLLHPVEASSLRNASISSDTNKTELDFLSGPSMQGISIALTSMVTLFIGFILGALCWKKIACKHMLESDQTTQSNICQEDNEISMLQQKEKTLLQV
ncbi:kit ligand isoform X1 [Varanus komodoensis]|uniref:kit ligand isoform X1 n=2 Tax=Varanus komodoensis TaxID=61221 RepID=UPI001CF7D443|nr:kit ligand isoform X1 [Varanus komodoensis]